MSPPFFVNGEIFLLSARRAEELVAYLISDDAHRRPFDKKRLRGTVTRILPAGKISHDAMRVKVKGKWWHLYRATDSDGNLVDSRLSEKRDVETAQQFFKQALAVVGHALERATMDGHTFYPQAVRETLGDYVLHRTNKYLNNFLEQDHRGVKQRYRPLHGFGNFDSAARFCSAFDKLCSYLRPCFTLGKPAMSSEQRQAFLNQLTGLKDAIQAA
jgi:transposase-like protein